ncbi:restriction endonuclease subunit S [Vreelandella zhaodongensis]|uniref:restriction endonuclease subunit S n=1 Tax=Vreelandella zhaodongensis TaxID=1176240 RepID=UPI003EBAFBAF
MWEVGEKDSYRQIASSEWIVVRQPQVESRYLLRFFQSSQFRLKLCADVTGVGGSLTRAQPKKVAAFPVTLPPIAEQKIIADKLDTLLAQVENTKARLERIPTILKRFRQSVLAAAVSGRLTEKWRELNSSQFPYERRQLAEIILEMRNGLSVIFNPVVQITAFKQPVYYARFRALFLGSERPTLSASIFEYYPTSVLGAGV